jgi:hypothetical protein
MTADDILYSPISAAPVIDQAIIANIALALGDPSCAISWAVDVSVTLDTYRRVVEVIEADPVIDKAASRIVVPATSDPRPTGALTMTELFERLHKDKTARRYYWTRKGSPSGVETIEFLNMFGIVAGVPFARMSDGLDYEWWTIGLMSNFSGFQGFYAFAEHKDAQKFWSTTP